MNPLLALSAAANTLPDHPELIYSPRGARIAMLIMLLVGYGFGRIAVWLLKLLWMDNLIGECPPHRRTPEFLQQRKEIRSILITAGITYPACWWFLRSWWGWFLLRLVYAPENGLSLNEFLVNLAMFLWPFMIFPTALIAVSALSVGLVGFVCDLILPRGGDV